MVTPGRIALSAVGLLLSFAALADITLDDYNKALGYGEEKIDYSGTLTPHDKIHTLIPEAEKAKPDANSVRTDAATENKGVEEGKQDQTAGIDNAAPAVDQPVASQKVGTDQGAKKAVGEKNSTASPRKNTASTGSAGSGSTPASGARNGAYLYFSPSLGANAGANIQSNSAQIVMPAQQVITFGIPIGTQIKVVMDKSATNIQPGYVVLVVDETVRGQIRDLARGTKLFASPRTELGSERLFLTASKGLVLGELAEFDMAGAIYSSDGKPGLPAVVLNDGKTLERATTTVANNLASGLIGAVASGDFVTAAGKAGAEAVTDEKTEDRETKTGRPMYIVQANPQKAVLRIEKTF